MQTVDTWSLHFSHISTSGFGGDTTLSFPTSAVARKPVTGAATEPYPLVTAASGPQGIGPGLSVAIDNTLGGFSPFEGRLYIGYTSIGTGGTNTDVYLVSADNLQPSGLNFNSAVRVNDDSASDNFSEGIRPQFMPTVAVDQSTGTVGVMYYDGRWDPSLARVANSFSASIDGGRTFSASTFLNTPKTATDMITGKSITIEPVPGNQGQAPTTFGFGDRQGLVMAGGHAIPVFSSNDNIGHQLNGTVAGSDIKTATVTVAAGPRIIFGDMGPITSTFTSGGIGHNDTFASDGTRQFTGFVVQFDRPVDPGSFNGDDVTVEYRDTVTPPSSPANLTVTGAANFTVTPLDASTAGWGPESFGGPMATTFLVSLAVPLSGVGTYSYSVGPDIHDNIRNPNSSSSGSSGTTFTASGCEINLVVPPSGTGGSEAGDGNTVWSTPPAGNLDTTTSTIAVNGLVDPISDVNIRISVTHSFSADLSMRLVAPDGTIIELTTENGGGASNAYANTTFDDQATVSVSAASTPYTLVQPEDPLSVLNGMLPAVANGNWYLQINDNFSGDAGTLVGWSLTFNGSSGSISGPGNLMDQNQNAVIAEEPLDVFAVPTPVNGTPFQLPYTQDTLPLIIPGPHVVDTSVAFNPAANLSATDNLVLNGTNNAVDVTFDRDIDPTTFTPANIVRIVGPVGPITTYTLGPAVSFSGGGGTGASGIATIVGGVITAVTITNQGSGYTSAPTVLFSGGGGIQAAGTATIASGKVTGVTITSPGIGYSSTSPIAIPDNGTLNVPMTITDSLQVNNLSVGLDITHARVSDLTVSLVAPDGTQVQLFPGGTGADLSNTVFDDYASTFISAGSAPYTGTFRPMPGITRATIAAGGSGYTVNDILTVLGGSFVTPAVLRVTSVNGAGTITGIAILQSGAYGTQPFNPVSVTGGTGTSAKFNLTFAGLSSLNGKNYLGTWTLRITDNVARADRHSEWLVTQSNHRDAESTRWNSESNLPCLLPHSDRQRHLYAGLRFGYARELYHRHQWQPGRYQCQRGR